MKNYSETAGNSYHEEGVLHEELKTIVDQCANGQLEYHHARKRVHEWYSSNADNNEIFKQK